MDNFGLWSLVPPLVAIALALLTREIVLSLFVAICSGVAIYVGFSPEPLSVACTTVGDRLYLAIADKDHTAMIVFLCFLGALVSVLTRAGGRGRTGNGRSASSGASGR